MPYRSETLTTEEYYHIFNRSIAGFRILENPNNCKRFMQSARYYRASSPDMRFSKFLELFAKTKNTGFKASSIPSKDERLVETFCKRANPGHSRVSHKCLTQT